MKSGTKPISQPPSGLRPGIFAGLFGAFLGLALLKFGNPPIMEKWVTTPNDFYEFLLGYPWPMGWAYTLLVVVVLAGLFSVGPGPLRVPTWLILLPLAWLIWELLAGTQSVDARLTNATLKHFAACVVCFYLGFFWFGRGRNLFAFWVGLFCGFVLVLIVGLEQHFGGLEESRRYFFLYIYPQMKEPPPPEYLKKISSSRIFSTLFYPNALAGALLLLLPMMLALLSGTRRLTTAAKAFVIGLVGLAATACLYWSGSKGGWLLMLVLGLSALLRMQFRTGYKLVLVMAVLLVGLTGFYWKYSSFFKRGATSVSARFDYWRAAAQTVRSHPVFGTGPGTFAIPYAAIKRPESEMSRLVHNDYLEQASDSGLAGCLIYILFIGGVLVWSFPRVGEAGPVPEWLAFTIWLGVLGWSLQCLLEFGLYIPGLAWPAFALMGLLLRFRALPTAEMPSTKTPAGV